MQNDNFELWVNILSIRSRAASWMRHDCWGFAITSITFSTVQSSHDINQQGFIPDTSHFVAVTSGHSPSAFPFLSMISQCPLWSIIFHWRWVTSFSIPIIDCIDTFIAFIFFFGKTSFMPDYYTITPFQSCFDTAQVVQEKVRTTYVVRASCCICIF